MIKVVWMWKTKPSGIQDRVSAKAHKHFWRHRVGKTHQHYQCLCIGKNGLPMAAARISNDTLLRVALWGGEGRSAKAAALVELRNE